jgi:hypothetical protein
VYVAKIKEILSQEIFDPFPIINDKIIVATSAILYVRIRSTVMTNLTEIYSEWQSNLKFREDFKKNPEQALKDAGLEVSPEDLIKIKAMLKLDKSKNEKLDDRISK